MEYYCMPMHNVKSLGELTNAQITDIVEYNYMYEYNQLVSQFDTHEKILDYVNSQYNRKCEYSEFLEISFDAYLTSDLKKLDINNIVLKGLHYDQSSSCKYMLTKLNYNSFYNATYIDKYVIREFLEYLYDEKYVLECKQCLKLIKKYNLTLDQIASMIDIGIKWCGLNAKFDKIPNYIFDGLEYVITDLHIPRKNIVRPKLNDKQKNIIYTTVRYLINHVPDNKIKRHIYANYNKIYYLSLDRLNTHLNRLYATKLKEYNDIYTKYNDKLTLYRKILDNKGPFIL